MTLALARRPARAAGGAARAHRGHRVDRARHRARRRARGGAGQARRRLLGAHALLDGEGGAPARARAPAGARRRAVRDAPRRPRPDRRLCRRRDDRDDVDRRDRPRPELADRCAEAGAWLHVDAAYAGSAAVCPELRPLFAGWERADSIGVNPHKWLFTPMDCSAFWSGRPDDLRNAFSLVPEYLRASEDVVSLSEYSVPLGRRFRALKLWAVLRCYGREGLQAVDPRARAARRALRGMGARGARLGGLRAASLLAGLLPARRVGRGERGAARAGQRDRRGLPLAHPARRSLRAAARDRQRAHGRGRRPRSPGTCCGARRGA